MLTIMYIYIIYIHIWIWYMCNFLWPHWNISTWMILVFIGSSFGGTIHGFLHNFHRSMWSSLENTRANNINGSQVKWILKSIESIDDPIFRFTPWISQLPSGNDWHSYWNDHRKFVSVPINSMVTFQSHGKVYQRVSHI